MKAIRNTLLLVLAAIASLFAGYYGTDAVLGPLVAIKANLEYCEGVATPDAALDKPGTGEIDKQRMQTCLLRLREGAIIPLTEGSEHHDSQ